MFLIQLIISAVAVYLFLVFLAQPFLFISRTLPRLLSPKEGPLGSATEKPDDVDPMPLEDLNQVFFAIELGRDRFGRMVYKGYDRDGGYKFYHHEVGLRRVRDIRSVPMEELENWDALHGRA